MVTGVPKAVINYLSFNHLSMAKESFYTIDWKIVNLNSWCEAVHGKSITSPDEIWTWSYQSLELFPRGESGQDDHMTVRLYGAKIGIKWDLSYIGFDGSVINFHQGKITAKNESFPGPKFEDTVAPKGGLKDEMTVRIRLQLDSKWEQRMRTTIEVSELSFKIDPELIENFHSIEPKSVLYVRYSLKKKKGIHLMMARQDESIQFRMEPYSEVKNPVLLTIDMDLLSRDYASIKKENTKHVFVDEKSWSFLKLKELEEKGTTIILHVKIVNGETIQSYNYGLDAKVSIATGNTCLSKLELRKDSVSSNQSDDSVTVLSKELMCLFQDQDYSDFYLKCDNVTFPVHKNILSARSPVFKTMLSCDMTESASGQVDITDLEPSTLALFLTFLYTGLVEKDLLGIEPSTSITRRTNTRFPLKRDCADFLSANLTISNVCDVLSLADKHKDDSLISVCHNFILDKYSGVMESNIWDIFMEKEPMLALKTYHHFVQKKYIAKVV